MPPRSQPIVLTESLITARHPRLGPDHMHLMPRVPEAAVDAVLDRVLDENGRGRSLWLFAYGSLLWRPDHEPAESRHAFVRGWHRRFCLWQWASRGTRDRPCLMLAIDAGGACRGVAYRIPPRRLREHARPVFRRELGGDGYRAHWVRALTPEGPVHAITFVVNRAGARYAGRLEDTEVARHIAGACGGKGACADYLRRAVESLAGLGMHDSHLWRIQALVARHLEHP